MKRVFCTVSAILFLNVASAADYSGLIPKGPLSLKEARQQLELIKQAENDGGPAGAEHRAKIAAFLAQKDQAQKQAVIEKEKCNREINCISRVHNGLLKTLSGIQDEIRKENDAFEKIMAADKEQLRKILQITVLETVAYTMMKRLESEQSKGSLILETDILPTVILDKEFGEDVWTKIMGKPMKLNDPVIGSLAVNYFFRTSETETEIALAVFANPAKATRENLEQVLLAPDAETRKTLFGQKKENLNSVVLGRSTDETYDRAYEFTENLIFNVEVMKNSAVSLK